MANDEDQNVWKVNITRTGYGHRSVEIVGPKTEREAIIKADELAGDMEFSESSSDYSFPDGAILVSGSSHNVATGIDKNKYISSPTVCPKCSSQNLSVSGKHFDCNYCVCNIICDECRSSWDDIYTLTGINNFESGDKVGEYSNNLMDRITIIDPTQDVSVEFCEQAFADGVSTCQAIESWFNDCTFNIETLVGINGCCSDFHQEVRKLIRPYIKITESVYKSLLDAPYDYYKTKSGIVFTFGTADGGYALMPLKESAASKLLA